MNEKTYCMLIHFSVFAGYAVPIAGLIVPIVLWQLKKNEMPSVDAHGKMVLNFILIFLALRGGFLCAHLCTHRYSIAHCAVDRMHRAADYRWHQSQ